MATEKRLISAKELERQIKEAFQDNPYAMGQMLRWIRKQPTVDAVEVVHGRWEPELMPTGVEYTGCAEMTVQAMSCSVCGKCVDVSEGYFLYCPNCGASMRDGDGDG